MFYVSSSGLFWLSTTQFAYSMAGVLRLSIWGGVWVQIHHHHLGAVSLTFCELPKKFSRENTQHQKLHLWWEFQSEKPCIGHTYKVSAWNSHHRYYLCNTQISREFLESSRNVSETTPRTLDRGVCHFASKWNSEMDQTWYKEYFLKLLPTSFAIVYIGVGLEGECVSNSM